MSATTTMELREAPIDQISTDPTSHEESSIPAAKVEQKGTTSLIIATITGVTMISSLLNGLVTISLPAMAKDLDIPQALLLW